MVFIRIQYIFKLSLILLTNLKYTDSFIPAICTANCV